MKPLFTLIVAALLLASCKKDDPINEPSGPATTMEELRVASDFSFSTFDQFQVYVQVLDLDDQPIANIRVDFYEGDSILAANHIGKVHTDMNGQATWTGRILTKYKTITAHAKVAGMPNVIEVNCAPQVQVNFGGSNYASTGKRGNSGKVEGVNGTITHAGGNFYYFGSYSNLGVPDYLEAVGDNIGAGFLSDINASLPENYPVPSNNAHYLASGNETEIVITQLADVWMTFVHEGAGYRNSLGFYTYPTNNPPASASDIDSIFMVFPNFSFLNSGGGLLAGDKVKLGTFPSGTSIGFVIIPNGWHPATQTIKPNVTPYYSNPNFNPEATAANRQHNVQLYDNARGLLLTGFEDINRDSPSCDQDFNDAIFYVTSNPITAIQTSNIPPTTNVSLDTDADGVSDADDQYPADAGKAFNYSYSGVLGFEDLWPFKGDYDFNDVVVDYSIQQVSNAQNQIVQINGAVAVRAVGAGKTLGMAIRLGNLPASSVQSVTGTSPGSAVLTGSGVEAGQSDAVVVLFDDVYDYLNRPTGAFYNTDPNKPAEAIDTIYFSVVLNAPVDVNTIGLPPYDAFIVPEGIQGGATRVEVHLPDFAATDLFDSSRFGFGDDDSTPSSGRYFRTNKHLPWAINVDGQYDHPIEYEPIIGAYNNFATWAESRGQNNPDWFEDKPGNRNNNKIW